MISKNDIENYSRIHPRVLAYLNKRLDEWAGWFIRKEDNGQGYPKQSIEYKLMTQGNVTREASGPRPLPVNESAEEMENIIRIMAGYNKQSKKYAEVLRAFYIKGRRNKRQAAIIVGISEAQFYICFEGARLWLAGWFMGRYGEKFMSRLVP